MTVIRRGRPRSESSRQAILEATGDLIAEVGYDAMTIESIASRAGVGRATIYRWWKSKSAIVADAVVSGCIPLPDVKIPSTGSLSRDLKSWIHDTAEVLSDPGTGQLVRGLATAASQDVRESELLYRHITGPNYEALVARLHSGKSSGQLPETADPHAMADALIGTSLFHTLTRQNDQLRMGRVVDALLPAQDGPSQD